MRVSQSIAEMDLTKIGIAFMIILQAVGAEEEGCWTKGDKQCIFPFKYVKGGKDYYECTEVRQAEQSEQLKEVESIRRLESLLYHTHLIQNEE